MHVEVELVVVLIASLALAAGAAMQTLTTRVKVPYTVAMLVLGLAAGFVVRRLNAASPEPGEMIHVLGRMEQLSPDLIIFVFLPGLVFQSAFAFDAYLFKKKLAAIGLLAGPALLVCAGLTAVSMVGLTQWSWGWGWRSGTPCFASSGSWPAAWRSDWSWPCSHRCGSGGSSTTPSSRSR